MCCDSTTSSAARAAGTGLRAIVYESDASPLPFGVAPSAIQFACADTDQVQSRAADTVNVPVPPVSLNCIGVATAFTWHLLAEGAVALVDVDVHAAAAARQAAPAAASRRL